MKKPTSVQFKFFKDLSFLTDPTEPRMPTVKIPAQHQERLSRRIKVQQPPVIVPVMIFLGALAFDMCIFLVLIYR